MLALTETAVGVIHDLTTQPGLPDGTGLRISPQPDVGNGSSPAFASVSCWRCVRSISPSLAWDSDVRRRSSDALYRSTNFLSVQACESSISEAARQRSTNSRRCSAEVNALSRTSFNNGVEEGDPDCALTVRLGAPDRSTAPGAVRES